MRPTPDRRRPWPLAVAATLVALGCATAATVTAPIAPAAALVAGPLADSPVRGLGQLVVKLAPGVAVDDINSLLGSTTGSVLLASRSLYLLAVPLDRPSTDHAEAAAGWAKQAKRLVHELGKDRRVVYAEANSDADSTEGERFHYWPNGGPDCVGRDPALYTRQRVTTQLDLVRVHRLSTGAGTVIAILDTGVIASHPAFSGRIAAGGYDYVDDDPNPVERRDGLDQDRDGRTDEGYGHGTFVAGVAALIAPDAKILPERVLDTEGRGSVFTVAEAIYDATAAGADVVNMSFGTADRLESKILKEAIHAAVQAGVVFVGAAGNDGTGTEHYPAAFDGVLSVGALDSAGTGLADFSSRGGWVDLAAPGTHVASALPCGYGYWSGTSVAAPFVSAEAALVLSSRPPGKAKKKDTVDKRISTSCHKIHGMSVHSGAIDLLRSLSG